MKPEKQPWEKPEIISSDIETTEGKSNNTPSELSAPYGPS